MDYYNMAVQKGPNVFQQFALAFVPARYPRLARVKTGSMILFVTLLALVSTVFSAISQAVSFSSIDVEALRDQIPDFTITDGHLSLEEDYLYEEDGMYLYITDDTEGFTYGDASQKAAEGYRDIILVGRDMICVMQNNGGVLKHQYIGFETFGRNKSLSKNLAFEAIMPLLIVVMIGLYLGIFVGSIAGYFLFAAVYLLFAMLIAAMMKKQIRAGTLFRAAVYSKVLMYVVNMLLGLVPYVNLTVPFLLRVAVTMGFMAFAIAKLPDERPAPMPPMPPMGPGMGMGPGGQWGQGGQGWQ